MGKKEGENVKRAGKKEQFYAHTGIRSDWSDSWWPM